MNNYSRSRSYRHVAGKFIVPKINGIIAPDGGWWYTKDEFYRWVEENREHYRHALALDYKQLEKCEDRSEYNATRRYIEMYERFLTSDYEAAEVMLCKGCVMLLDKGVHQHYGLPWSCLSNCLAVKYRDLPHRSAVKWLIQYLPAPRRDEPLYDTRAEAERIFDAVGYKPDKYEILPVEVCEGCYRILDRTVFGARFIFENITVDSCPIAYTTRGAGSDVS